MNAICVEPYNNNPHPIQIKNGGWVKKKFLLQKHLRQKHQIERSLDEIETLLEVRQ